MTWFAFWPHLLGGIVEVGLEVATVGIGEQLGSYCIYPCQVTQVAEMEMTGEI